MKLSIMKMLEISERRLVYVIIDEDGSQPEEWAYSSKEHAEKRLIELQKEKDNA